MAPNQSKILCIWLNQKREPCPWQRMSDNCDFCKRHSKYDGIYTKDDIPNLIWCSGCPDVFPPKTGETFKQCLPCRTRGSANNAKLKEKKNETKKQCLGIVGKQNEKENGTGKKCSHGAPVDDDYCGKCQTYKKWKELINDGNKVCKNWIRGCFECITDDYQKCQTCRSNNQITDKISIDKKITNANMYDSKNEDTKMCVKCNKTDKHFKIKNRKCEKCFDTYKKAEANRSLPDPLMKKLSWCKKSAKDRNIEWNISDQTALSLIQSKCTYCDKLVAFNGIDRINSEIGYVDTNVVACCSVCNIMKHEHTVENFIKIVTYLLTINFYIEGSPNENDKQLFKFSQSALFSRFLGDAKKKNKAVEITESMYQNIIGQPCNYCKNTCYLQNNIGARGIDRIDSMYGYIPGNIVPCCSTCNYMKSNLSVGNFFGQLLSIYNFYVLNIETNELSLPEQIMNICKTVKPIKPEKFLKNPEYYENLVYNCNNLDELYNIKIEIEFVRDKKQKDIWNYFRKNVSSLNKQDNAKQYGRQIYMLIKDSSTQKYLGIMSLNSDLQSLELRDKAINWDFKNRIENLDYLMNISTCVPLQPFGFNFNGGKLLASLAFSKEVLTYFYSSYNHELLGLTTTSLYGKSIQYDRLECLKYVGLTKGNSVKDIPSEVVKLCANYLKHEYNQEYPSRKKYIILQSAFNKLGLSKEDLLRSNQKGIYFGFTHKKSQDFLLGKIKTIPNVRESAKTAKEIFQWWLDRWATQRFYNLEKKKQLKSEVDFFSKTEIQNTDTESTCDDTDESHTENINVNHDVNYEFINIEENEKVPKKKKVTKNDNPSNIQLKK